MTDNPLIQDLQQGLSDRYSVDRLSMSVSDWITENTTLNRRPFSFKGYEFQRAIMDDMFPDVNVKKCSQVGLTEVQLRKFLAFLKRNRGRNAFFTLPDERLRQRVSQTRIAPVLKDQVFQASDNSDIRNQTIVQFGNSFGFVTGLTEADATSTPADALFHDEIDLSDQRMLALFQSRLQNSALRITQRFSTPTFAKFAVDAEFHASDQRHYLCPCDACGEWNDVSFDTDHIHLPGLEKIKFEELHDIQPAAADSLNFKESYFKCSSCGSRLDLTSERREWVPSFHTRSDFKHGYHVRPTATGRLDIPYIFKLMWSYQSKDSLRGWYNTVLGETYEADSQRISREDVLACMAQDNPDAVGIPVSVGIDVGQVCHMVVGNEEAVFEFSSFAQPELVNRVNDVFERYDVQSGAIDRYPYTPTSNMIRDHTENIIVPVEYSTGARMQIVQSNDDIEDMFPSTDIRGHVRANRTNALDSVAWKFRKRLWTLYGVQKFGSEKLITQLRNSLREESAEAQAKWIKLDENDHMLHALALMLLGVVAREQIWLMSGPDLRTEVMLAGVDSTGLKKEKPIGLTGSWTLDDKKDRSTAPWGARRT